MEGLPVGDGDILRPRRLTRLPASELNVVTLLSRDESRKCARAYKRDIL